MAPVRTKKGECETNNNSNVLSSPSVRTPERSPIKKPIMISQGQKQALIDNLQLEVTERARKLRAQYALQAQSLRTRVELRVNRIPTALRRANMGELLEKHMGTQKKDREPKPAMKQGVKSTSNKALPKPPTILEEKPAAPIYPTRTRGTKRKSDVLIPIDKENTDPIPNPKKRTKTTTTTTKIPSRQVTNPSSVLSPKSSNSRTLPHSPFRSPQKPMSTRPISPLKPAIPLQSTSPAKAAAVAATSNLATLVTEKLKPTRAAAAGARKVSKPVAEPKPAVTRSKKGAATATLAVAVAVPASRTVSGASNISGTSTGTTVVKKAGRPTAAAKKGVGISAAGKKVTATKVDVPAPAAGRRVLRKRA
ncbi:MAG: hypothetical protein Q9187_007680 [Circinaria calcarea]